MYQLQSGAPAPPTIRPTTKGRRKKYPFEQMKVKEYFFVPGKTKNTLGTHVYTVGRELGHKYTVRLCHMHQVGGIWIPCAATETGATQGIGVWRKA